MSESKGLSRILERLAEAPFSIRVEPGLTESEFCEIEARYEMAFPPDLRALLSIGTPVGVSPPPPGATGGGHFPDWRNGDDEALRAALSWPVESVLSDVRENVFWGDGWPDRPDSIEEALALARHELANVPKLVPIYGHRYIPSAPAESGNPVFSIYQTDVICYGVDVPDYFENEFFDKNSAFHRNGGTVTEAPRHIAFWSDLAGF